MKKQLMEAKIKSARNNLKSRLERRFPNRTWTEVADYKKTAFIIEDENHRGIEVDLSGIHSYHGLSFINKNTTLEQAIKDIE